MMSPDLDLFEMNMMSSDLSFGKKSGFSGTCCHRSVGTHEEPQNDTNQGEYRSCRQGRHPSKGFCRDRYEKGPDTANDVSPRIQDSGSCRSVFAGNEDRCCPERSLSELSTSKTQGKEQDGQVGISGCRTEKKKHGYKTEAGHASGDRYVYRADHTRVLQHWRQPRRPTRELQRSSRLPGF
jgi:hypothetical protein